MAGAIGIVILLVLFALVLFGGKIKEWYGKEADKNEVDE